MSIIEKALEKTALEKNTDTSQVSGVMVKAHEYFDGQSDSVVHEKIRDKDVGLLNYDVEVNFRLLEEKGMLLPDVAQSQISEEYRIIKRPLVVNAFGEGSHGINNSNLILVTSSLPGEGKTFTAVNLALSIATERDKTVLLVDADVEKPTITSQIFNIHGREGLTNLLLDSDLSFSDVLLRTSIPNLSILPAGKRHKHSTELLASEKMVEMTAEMSRRYSDRIIIFDSPPLMVATQASVLAAHVGQVVLVIETERTPQFIVKEAVSKLAACDVVACVLNKTKKGFGLNYYAYYGYYGRQ